MKPALLSLLLCSCAIADGVYRPAVRPYRKIVTLTWCQIPYPAAEGRVTLRDGKSYAILNPDGHACEPWFHAGDSFDCHVTVDLDEMTIDAVRLLQPKECEL